MQIYRCDLQFYCYVFKILVQLQHTLTDLVLHFRAETLRNLQSNCLALSRVQFACAPTVKN